MHAGFFLTEQLDAGFLLMGEQLDAGFLRIVALADRLRICDCSAVSETYISNLCLMKLEP